MTAKRVAVEGDVKAEPLTVAAGPKQCPSPAVTGGWTLVEGSLRETVHPAIRIAGKRALLKVSCTFTFDGKTSSNPPAEVKNITSAHSLKASSTVLRSAEGGVLRDGDAEPDQWGNRLVTRAAGPVASA